MYMYMYYNVYLRLCSIVYWRLSQGHVHVNSTQLQSKLISPRHIQVQWKLHLLLKFILAAGGTDIISCFAGQNPTVPVYRGEIQTRNLGMAMECWNEDGKD